MKAAVPTVGVARATVGSLAIGRLAVGPIHINRLSVQDAAIAVRSGSAQLRGVALSVQLDFQLEWRVGIDVGMAERGWRWCRRNPALASAIVVISPKAKAPIPAASRTAASGPSGFAATASSPAMTSRSVAVMSTRSVFTAMSVPPCLT